MIRARACLSAIFALLVFAASAAAQGFEPRTGRSYVVRDLRGQVLERLRPTAGGYVRYDVAGRRLGRAVPGNGGQLSFFDTSGALIATARRDGKPPMALRLNAIAVIHGSDGGTLGIVAAR